jgi:2-polyprenyl-3-methyl-5-hydroxy-6-metoxy-1,4-benzoquinol methylase
MEFHKYSQRGAYHWQQISRNPHVRRAFVVGRYQNLITLVRRFGGGCAGKHLLDVGCGDGALSWLFSLTGAQVTGVDVLPLALTLARRATAARSAAVQWLGADACTLPFKDDVFDLVVSSDTVEHLAAPWDLLREMARVLKPQGWAVISTPIRLTSLPLDAMHVQEWFAEDFEALVGSVMIGGQRFESHPVFWMELAMRHQLFNVGINLASLVWNPFAGFSSGFRHRALQYYVWQKPTCDS